MGLDIREYAQKVENSLFFSLLLAAHLARRQACGVLLQDLDDLLFSELALTHRPSANGNGLYSKPGAFRGAGHEGCYCTLGGGHRRDGCTSCPVARVGLAPGVGFGRLTWWLTTVRSATDLPGNW